MTDTYIENLKIGGGKGAVACGNSPAGGCTIANDGDISTDGTVQIDDTLTLGEVGNAGEIALLGSTSGRATITTDATASKVTSDKPVAAKTSLQIDGSTSGTATLAVDAATTKATLDKPLEVTGGITASTALTGATLEVGGGYGSAGLSVTNAGNVSANGTAQIDGVLTVGLTSKESSVKVLGKSAGYAMSSVVFGDDILYDRYSIAARGPSDAAGCPLRFYYHTADTYHTPINIVPASGGSNSYTIDLENTVNVGKSATIRGVIKLYRGASTNTPGYVAFTDSAGTAHNFWASTTGGVRIHTAAPAANTDGAPVSYSGSEIHFSTLSGTPASLTLTNQSTWYPLVQFTSGDSVSVGSDTTTTVTGGPRATAAYITAVTAGTYLVTLSGSFAQDGTNQEIHVGIGLDGADPTGKFVGGHTKLTTAAAPAFFNFTAIKTLTAGQLLRACFYNHTSAGKILSFEQVTLRAQRIA